jgi:peptide/nickel transport system permease protein/dipeptide transport system permease protein
MRKFLVWRAAGLVAVLLLMTLVVFLLRQVIPSDPARAAVGPNAPASVVAAKRHELGLDRPLLSQYGTYLRELAGGDLGTSSRTHSSVASDVARFLPASLELVLFAVLFALVIAAVLALAQTLLRRSGWLSGIFLSGASAPIFLTSLLLVYVLWYKLHLLPSVGRTSVPDAPDGPTGLLTVDGLLHGRPYVTWDAIQFLVMPALALAVPMGVAVGRSLRSSLVGVLRQDYVRTARSKGLSEGAVIRRHALRNASTGPLSMAGLQVGLVFANLLIVERIFAWPGLGLYTVQSLGQSDLTAVLGVALVFGAAYVVLNTLVDLAQAWVDPRVSLQ